MLSLLLREEDNDIDEDEEDRCCVCLLCLLLVVLLQNVVEVKKRDGRHIDNDGDDFDWVILLLVFLAVAVVAVAVEREKGGWRNNAEDDRWAVVVDDAIIDDVARGLKRMAAGLIAYAALESNDEEEFIQ